MASNDHDALKASALRATEQLLEPWLGLLIEAGLGVGNLESLVRRAYVSAARKTLGTGRKPTVSSIAAITGLSRAEVTRIVNDTTGCETPASGTNRAERVLQGWWNDADYQDDAGLPRKLPIQGPRRSFATLAETYSGDRVPAAVLDELLRVKAVRELSDGRVEALRRHVGEVRWSPQGLETLSARLRSHLETLLYNLRNPSRPHYERVIDTARLNPDYAARLIRDLTSQMEVLADSMDHELNDPEVTAPRHSAHALRLGVGFYLFEAPADEAPPASETPPSRARRRRTPPRSRQKNT